MSCAAAVIFWICAIVTAYVYAGYPALLASGILGRKRPARRGVLQPSVSIIIPAYNEAETIAEKLRNCTALQYPAELVEVLVGSDGSTDSTGKIVREHAGVKFYESAAQMGKSSIQNEVVARSSGEILVFTDCDCFLDPDALTHLIENFADETVGLVTARPSYVNAEENDVTQNEGIYLRYESWIRGQESERGLLAVASGSLFAIRRSLWTPLPANLGDDFLLPLRTVLQGRRNILEPCAGVRTELSQKRLHSMIGMKRRIISKDFLALLKTASVLNPMRTGAVAVALLSHKLLRWMVPYFLASMFISNLLLLRSPWARVFLLLQTAFYLLAALGAVCEARGVKSILLVPTSFCAVNLAAALAIMQCATGRTLGQWRPVRAAPVRVER